MNSITKSVSVHIIRINVSSTFFSLKAIELIKEGCVAVAVAVCIGDPHRGY